MEYEDEKMLKIGSWALVVVVVLTAVLQVCYRTQNRERRMVRHEFESVQHEIVNQQARFEFLIRPEYLIDKVVGINPKAETVGYSKNVNINDLGFKK